MRRMRHDAATEIGRLLRLLLLRLRSVPANTGGANYSESGRMLQYLNSSRVNSASGSGAADAASFADSQLNAKEQTCFDAGA
jgi:hypothetical protein